MKKNDILILLVPMCIIAILWVVFSIYHSFVTSTIPESLNTQIIEISPNFDMNAIEKIKQRSAVEPVVAGEQARGYEEVPAGKKIGHGFSRIENTD